MLPVNLALANSPSPYVKITIQVERSEYQLSDRRLPAPVRAVSSELTVLEVRIRTRSNRRRTVETEPIPVRFGRARGDTPDLESFHEIRPVTPNTWWAKWYHSTQLIGRSTPPAVGGERDPTRVAPIGIRPERIRPLRIPDSRIDTDGEYLRRERAGDAFTERRATDREPVSRPSEGLQSYGCNSTGAPDRKARPFHRWCTVLPDTRLSAQRGPFVDTPHGSHDSNSDGSLWARDRSKVESRLDAAADEFSTTTTAAVTDSRQIVSRRASDRTASARA